jgi:diguanylate cyclase (GGDEF)-like protein
MLVTERTMAAAQIKTQPLPVSVQQGVIAFFVVGVMILMASLFGILTRPMGFLAAFWPANAILLGLMVCMPRLANPWGWLGALAGYLLADFSTGGEITVTFWLTFANMAGAFTGYLLYRPMSGVDRRLGRPQSVLYLLAICSAAAAVSALAGAGAAGIVFDRGFLIGFEFWFVTELVNSLVILPVMLTAPDPTRFKGTGHTSFRAVIGANWLPAAALAASLAAGVIVGGPGAIAFPVPALLWCALFYPMFVTAVMTSAFSAWLLIAIPLGFIDIGVSSNQLEWTSSLRLGVALMALGPLTVAAINSARAELMNRLAYVADHCSLTGVLSRRAFIDFGSKVVTGADGTRPVAVLMLDIDHFKSVNDRYGHAAGDRVLTAFADVVAEAVRSRDVIGRLGGEEFAIVLSGVTEAHSMQVAERIVEAVEAGRLPEDGQSIGVTVSIGVAHSTRRPASRFEDLLAVADEALYRAKKAGRNRAIMA